MRVYRISDEIRTESALIEKKVKELQAKHNFSDEHAKVLKFLMKNTEATFEEIQICTGIEPWKLKRILGR